MLVLELLLVPLLELLTLLLLLRTLELLLDGRLFPLLGVLPLLLLLGAGLLGLTLPLLLPALLLLWPPLMLPALGFGLTVAPPLLLGFGASPCSGLGPWSSLKWLVG